MNLKAWQRQALLLIAFVLVAAPLVGFRAVNDKPLSVYDEWQYADRVHAVTQGHLFMRDGEQVSGWGEVARACRGVERILPPLACTPDPAISKGTPNYAGPDPAPYFVLTGLAAAVPLKVGIVDNPVIAGRLVGIFWAGLSMWTLWLLARAFGATRPAAAVAASTVLLVPAFLQQYIHMTPHALDIPVGAFTALASLKFLRREWPVWVLPLAALTIVGVKGSNIVIAVAVGIAFAAVVLWPGTIERRDRLRAPVAGAVLMTSTLALFVGHRALISATRVADYDPPGFYAVPGLDWQAVTVDSAKFLSTRGEGMLGAPAVWLVLAMGGTALAVWAGLLRDPAPYVRQFAPGYLLGAAIGAVVPDVMVFATTEQYFAVHLRYGLAVFPLGIAFAALLLRTRTAIVLAFGFLVLYAAMPALLSLDTVAI
ncbi:hypothetical protein [Nocardioides sp. B-3]|uniref:hypothetical protein n=1 Tax=Nocardioides sp. B-3 TaxID=2895565 RepID=UPI002153067A|nr:hypothetical protein [Nocardioides sp. B-3]UUZ60007.1 hypothetical protein LP418_03045 [Nocardioides sp. B-3]